MLNEWFSEVFNSTSGKAQFLSITISSCLAIMILILNQWFTNRRERKKVYVEKIEELYLTSLDYLNACDELITDIQRSKYQRDTGYHRYNESVYSKMEVSISKIEMLCGLYFQKIHFDSKKYSITKMPIFWAATSGQIARKEVNTDEVLKQSRSHIETSSKDFKLMCRKLMKSKMM